MNKSDLALANRIHKRYYPTIRVLSDTGVATMPQPGHASNIPSNELVARLRWRKREILKTLAPDLLKEYRALGTTIRTILQEEVLFTEPYEIIFVGDESDAVAIDLIEKHEAAIASMSDMKIVTDRKPLSESADFPERIQVAIKETGIPCAVIRRGGRETVVLSLHKPDALVRTMRTFVRVGREMQSSPRTSMAEHKRRLIEFLGNRMASRGQILSHTGIPEGSLSQLLRDPEFVQIERGVWRLNDELKPNAGEMEAAGDFKVGDRVQHSHFGVGKITGISGDGEQRKIKVNFFDVGQRTLPAFMAAKLKIIKEVTG